MTITWDLNPFLSFIWNFRFSTILDVLDFLSFEFRSKNKIENRWKTYDWRNYLGTLSSNHGNHNISPVGFLSFCTFER